MNYFEAMQAGVVDELEKIGASFAKAKGLGRVKELLTGSRVKKLEDRVSHLKDRGSMAHTIDMAERAKAKLTQHPTEPAAQFRLRRDRADERGRRVFSKHHLAAELTKNEAAAENTKKHLMRGVAGGAAGVAAGGAIGAAAHKTHEKTK